MKQYTINLAKVEKSDIKYEIIKFPDGELHFKFLEDIDRKAEYEVKCRITCADDLFILAQVGNILNRQAVNWDLYIYYLMSMRCDRVFSFNEAFSLEVVGNIISSLSPRRIEILEPHSERTYKEVKVSSPYRTTGGNLFHDGGWIGDDDHKSGFFTYNYQPVLPDAGAYDRYGEGMFNGHSSVGFSDTPIICKKVRDVATGKLLKFDVENPEDLKKSDKPLLIIDDLCDGGGTFAGTAAMLRPLIGDRPLEIFVTHMVNPKGIQTLYDNFDKVYFTNSYKDWDITGKEDKTTIIDVI